MILSFRHRGLAQLWKTGSTVLIGQAFHRRILVRLDALDAAGKPEDMNVPGFNFHSLRGFEPVRYTVHVNGPWCVTFSFADGDASRVDFEQYH